MGGGEGEKVRKSSEETISEVLGDLRVLCPITTRGRASSSTRSQHSPPDPRLQVCPLGWSQIMLY